MTPEQVAEKMRALADELLGLADELDPPVGEWFLNGRPVTPESFREMVQFATKAYEEAARK